MNCWGGFTVFQMACILMLMVGIPFLIALIVIYIIYGVGNHESGSCAVLCCYYQQGRQFSLTTSLAIIDDDGEIILEDYSSPSGLPVRSLDFPTESDILTATENPSIGALLENLYRDDSTDTVFKCPVAIINKEWALTVDDCVSHGNLSVRIGSRYWSKGGTVKNVKDVVHLRKIKKPSLVMIRFETEKVVALKTAKMSDIYIRSYRWLNSFNGPLMKRKKFDTLKAVEAEFLQKDDCWEYKKPKHVSCYITRKSAFCGLKVNAPMIDSYDRLVGIHLETLCEDKKKYSVVFYINIFNYNVSTNIVI